jgi:lipopolysaccharide transport system ATP-binding protein
MRKTVIKVEHVSKKYSKTIKHSMVYGLTDIQKNAFGISSHSERLRPGEFWAVDDVSFEVKKGEIIGLIGPNGSGKTTLLKMLNGIFWPDKGKITIEGRVGALIAVGAGFHPLLTGRENIYLNGAILGMSKREIDKKFDAIIDFAEIGDFLDSPIKYYSSGMFVRLGFAIAAHCEPDILLVDEVLAVGDINFQHKCLRRISDLMENCAVIMVNHGPEIIRFTCNRVLFLHHGKTQFLGAASEGVDNYIDFMIKRSTPINEKIKGSSVYDPKAKIEDVRFFNDSGERITEINSGETLIIECTFTALEDIERTILGTAFYFEARERSFICYSSEIGQYYNLTKGTHTFRTIIPDLLLKKGVYHLALIVAEKNELATHTWQYPAYILVKNPRPELGHYNMRFHFELDNDIVKK